MDAGYVDKFGYIYVTARDDDVINVAGHRLSTAALEDVVMGHPEVGDAAVIGVPEPTKGEVPFCFFVLKSGKTFPLPQEKPFTLGTIVSGARKNEEEVAKDLVHMVRELVGPIAAFKLAVSIRALPRTRSGKIARKSISDLAKNKYVKVSEKSIPQLIKTTP